MIILCFGDSNTWGFDPRGYWGGQYDHPWPEILEQKLECTVINQGENGREIPVQPVTFPKNVELLIVMLGSNDLLQGLPPETVSIRMETFLQSLNVPKILLIAPPTMKLGTWVPNQKLIDNSIVLSKCYQSLTNRLGVQFVDAGQWNISLAFDGVHLTEEGHRIFAEGLYNYLNKGD